MSSILDKPAVRRAVLPITVEQYHRLGEAGIIPQNTELLRGIIVEKMIKSPLHSWIVQTLIDWLRPRVGEGRYVRQEQPLTLCDSEPEPDLAIAAGTPDDYRTCHPCRADLVIEVAISSADLDREKASLYASAGVDEFWLVLAEERAVEVFSKPVESAYTEHQRFTETDVICSSVLAGQDFALRVLFTSQ